MGHDPLSQARVTLEKHQENNIFVVMRYGEPIVFKMIEQTIVQTLKRFDFEAVLAKELKVDPLLRKNVEFCIDHSRYGIVVFEDFVEPDFNPNVAFELGYMRGKGKECLILKEESMCHLPTDVIGDLYTPFSSGNLEETLTGAIEKWLEGLGHSTVKATEMIVNDDPLEAKKERARRIISALSGAREASVGLAPDLILRHTGGLSSLAIADLDEPGDEEFRHLHLQEGRWMERLLEDGATVRCIISPDIQVEGFRHEVLPLEMIEASAFPRYKHVLGLLKQKPNRPNLQMAYAMRTPYDNLLIVGNKILFIGKRRLRYMGLPSTTVTHDSAVIRNEIAEFDALFHECVGFVLGVSEPQMELYGCPALKNRVAAKLEQCQRELKALLKTSRKCSASSHS